MKKQLLSALLAGCLVVGCIGPVSAEEITTSGGNGETPVVLTAEAMTFSVTVPTALPVDVAADGTVSTANNAEIINNGAGPVEVKSVKVEAVAPWVLVGNFADLSAEKVGTDKFSFSIQDANVAEDGTCAVDFDVIPAKDNIGFAYKAKVAPQNEATTNEQMAKVVFTLRWQELYTPFTVTKENRSMVGFTGEANENLVIPATFPAEDGIEYKVTSIGEDAFNSCTALTSVVIPNGVTSIGNGGFYNCNYLESVTIPNGVTSIGRMAFNACYHLASITIPDGVTSIEVGTFQSCLALTSITIPDSVASIGKLAFQGCNALTSITIGDSVTSIGEQAFANCSLTSIEIPDSVTSIGNFAFGGNSNSLTSITYRGTEYHSLDDFKIAFNAIDGNKMA